MNLQKIPLLLKKIAPLAMALLFCVAARIFYLEIRGVSLTELLGAFEQIPWFYILFSLLAVFCSYGLLTLNEYLGVTQCSERDIPYVQVARTSFISNAIGFNIGAAMLSGGSIRYNLYTALGLSPVEVARVIAFAQTSAILGTVGLNGSVLLFWPGRIFSEVELIVPLRHALGLLFLCVPAAAFFVSFRSKKGRDYFIFGYRIPIPAPDVLVRQFLIGFSRPFFTALVLFALLPPAEIGYIAFCGAFVLSALVGNLSMIPGGLGVFDAALVWILTPFYDPAELVGALVLYRLFYFILPLTAGLATLLFVKGKARYIGHDAKPRM